MNCEYTCKKKKYDLKEIGNAQILFSNGDFIELSGKEIVGLDLSLYDRLVYFHNCYFPVAKSGNIKFKIINKKPKYDNSSVYNQKEYLKDRKAYIENRLVKEGCVFAVRFFNELNWHDTILGDITAKKEDDFLILTFCERLSGGSADSENHFINLKNVRKEDFRILDISFENCDRMVVYQKEIKEINLNFENELEWNADGYCRVIKSGFIRLKFDKEYDFGRKASVYTSNGKLANFKHLEKRICEKGEKDIDISQLYVSNYHCGFGLEKEEVLETNDLFEYPDNYDEYEYRDAPYISGYAKKEKDGTILIVFGKRI